MVSRIIMGPVDWVAVAGYKLQVASCKLQVAGYKLQVAVYSLQFTGFGCQDNMRHSLIIGSGLQAA